MTGLASEREREARRLRKVRWKARRAINEHVPRITVNDHHTDALVIGGYLRVEDQFKSEKVGEAVMRLLDAYARAKLERVPGEESECGSNEADDETE